jgi:isopentenyl-diphosphate delta-isomerase type 1
MTIHLAEHRPPGTALEHVVLVDPHGRPTTTAPKADVHDHDTPLHLAFSCHVMRSDGAVLLTRRALHKPTWPGMWTNACCGHPALGETLRQAVTRRLAQELGVRPVSLAMALPDFAYRAEMADGTVEHELCPVVVALVDAEPLPDPREVDEVAWCSWFELTRRADAAPHTLSPWCVEQVAQLSARAPSLAGWFTGAGRTTALDDPVVLPGAVAAPAPRSTRRPSAARALDPVAAPLRTVLDDFLREAVTDSSLLHPAMDEVTEEIRSLVEAGGKRLRPAFVYWGHRATGADHDPAVLGPAAAVELLHTFALLHDDVMDRSVVRRGRPSAHVALADRHHDAAPGGQEREWFGCSAAILAGDLAYVWADRLFDRAALPADAMARARRVFTTLREEVIAGQYLDLRLASDPAASEPAARHVALLKSARYTVTRPLLLGAALGHGPGAAPGAEHALVEALTTYGDAVGVAFQMRDDVLGLFGDATETGKGTIDDVREGKRTVLMLRALRLASASQRAVLLAHLGDPDLDAGAAARVRDVVAATGALASVESLIGAEHATASRAIVGVPEPARGALEELAALSIERRS